MEHPAAIERMIEHSRSIKRKALQRVMVVVSLVTTWVIAGTTGVFLMAGPWGDIEAGNAQLFEVMVLGLSRRQWGVVHLVLSIVAVAVSLIHYRMEWRPFQGSLRQVTSRRQVPTLPGHAPPPPAPRPPRPSRERPPS
jgi:hypothetical protein